MPKILIIDDSNFQRKIISDILEKEGYSVVIAENGNSGFTMAQSEAPDAVVCDLLMPELDGYGFLEKIRDSSIDVPVIILTSDIQKTSRKVCLDLGAYDVLNKPVAKDSLIPALNKALGSTKKS